MSRDDDRALRPTSFDDFPGQESAKRNLRVFVRAALARGEPLDHVLFTGPPGTGKTTLAGVVASEMGANVVVVNATTIKTKGELIAILAGLSRNDVLFIDEIHALSTRVEEVLYTAMEDARVDVPSGGEALSIDLEPFTLIGATTVAGSMSQPLRDRFGEIVQMSLYSDAELSLIADRSAKKLGMTPIPGGPEEVARRSRGTPRIANRLLRRARDFAHADGHSLLNVETVVRTCEALGIDASGLDGTSRRYLELLAARGPVGLSVAAAVLGESEETIEAAVEPFLMRSGLIERTSKGRVATASGIAAVR